jgi:desulfoferrodoxin (superoxide reductase-like protein)
MNRRKFIVSAGGFFLFFILGGKNSWANKAETKIEVPENTAKGSEITIRVTVTHSANSFFHHTEWLQVKINEKEIARWDFTGTNKPEAATFTREIKYRVEGDVEIKAQASCNLHGSAGEILAKVSAQA